MGEVLNGFYCAGYDGRAYPMPLRMIEAGTMRRYAREAYREGVKDWKYEEAYLRMIGRIK
jgi:hypothetical protein